MIHAVLMVGGAGTRFWPRSRRRSPKYLLPIVGDKNMLEQTVERIEPLIPPERIRCITSASQAPGIRAALPRLPAENVVGEPMPRDSAACVGLGAVIVHHADPDAVILCMPGDNLIAQSEEFRATVEAASEIAESGKIVTFGIKPPAPETRFGYIHRGDPISARAGAAAFDVKRFTEKPDRETAEKMLESGDYYWNSGNFVWRADTILDAMGRYAPDLHAAMERIRPALGTDRAAEVIEREYEGLRKISIDYAVMEKAENVAVIEAKFDWDDVGSWTALERHIKQDDAGNTVIGKALLLESAGNIVSTTEDHLVATVGLDDCIVVHTPDATLVCPKDRANDVKELVQQLKDKGLGEYL